QGHAPRGVDAAGHHPPQETAVRVERVDDPVMLAVHDDTAAGQHLVVGDVERAVDVLDVEGPERAAGGQVRVLEVAARPQGGELEVRVEHVDLAGGLVGGVQEVRARGAGADGQPRVAGTGDGRLQLGRRSGVPGRDGAVQPVEDEARGLAVREDEVVRG